MENLINKIIEIDQKADKKMDDALKKKLEIEKDIALQKEQIIAQLNEKSTAKLAAFEQTERQSADEKMQIITDKKQISLKNLQHVFDANNQKWVNEIVGRVLKTN